MGPRFGLAAEAVRLVLHEHHRLKERSGRSGVWRICWCRLGRWALVHVADNWRAPAGGVGLVGVGAMLEDAVVSTLWMAQIKFRLG